jgi:hypothetical protein
VCCNNNLGQQWTWSDRPEGLKLHVSTLDLIWYMKDLPTLKFTCFIQTWTLLSLTLRKLGKAISLKPWTDPERSRKLRFSEILHNRHVKVESLWALSTGLIYPQGISLVPILFGGWVDHSVTVRPEVLCQWKTPTTLSGIGPVTFQLVVQRLKHVETN